MGAMAQELSAKRRQAAEQLETAVKKELGELNMAQVAFKIAIAKEESPDGVPFPDGRSYAFDAGGADRVEFMAATNPGEPLRPLARIASTGEISRFMLSIKSALAEADTTPVLIFDEIDIGVGGRSGEVIGRKLWRLARNRQVICVTHLPQIAAFSDRHYRVSKATAGDRATSTIEELPGDSSSAELAMMLSGTGYSAPSLNAARELLDRAQTWKGSV
jgi:DNA repair protein RecN (Recombination protein N)